jgi:predicted glycosyltransferase
LLSVDQDLVNKKKILHSRDPKEIVDYVINNWNKKKYPEFEKAKNVINEVIKIINTIINKK